MKQKPQTAGRSGRGILSVLSAPNPKGQMRPDERHEDQCADRNGHGITPTFSRSYVYYGLPIAGHRKRYGSEQEKPRRSELGRGGMAIPLVEACRISRHRREVNISKVNL